MHGEATQRFSTVVKSREIGRLLRPHLNPHRRRDPDPFRFRRSTPQKHPTLSRVECLSRSPLSRIIAKVARRHPVQVQPLYNSLVWAGRLILCAECNDNDCQLWSGVEGYEVVAVLLNQRIKSGQAGRKPRSRGLPLAAANSASISPPLGSQRRALLPKFGKRDVNAICSSYAIDEPDLEIRAPKDNIWAQISPEDNVAIWNLLHDSEYGLNLTHPDKAGINDN
ncbi:hypothetical protein DL769_000888 [Monosporascus sp. CRB-8-3]|nr:hypothetical protein DL769_000888 [Monosporascus sp. CRB-8-3]